MPWFIPLIAAGIGATNQLVGGIIQGVQNKKNLDRQKDQQDWQRQEWNWEKEMFQKQMDREDTAVQRRVADLEAAGLHPALAAGQGAAAGASPHSPTIQAPQRGNNALEVMHGLTQVGVMSANIMKTQAEAANIRRQTEHLDAMEKYYNARSYEAETNMEYLTQMRDTIAHNLSIARERGFMTTESSEMIRRFEYALELIDKILSPTFNFSLHPGEKRDIGDYHDSKRPETKRDSLPAWMRRPQTETRYDRGSIWYTPKS